MKTRTPNGTATNGTYPGVLCRAELVNHFPAPGEPVTDRNLVNLLPQRLAGLRGLLGALQLAPELTDQEYAFALLMEQLDWAMDLLERWEATKQGTSSTPPRVPYAVVPAE
jgi:hypothetical protein